MKLTNVVIDSCVFNKLFLQEFDRDQAIELIKTLNEKDIQITVPSLFLYEVLAVAATCEFDTKSVYELILQFRATNLHIVDLPEKVINIAIEICTQGHTNSGFPSFYDASYHALAIDQKTVFITADKRHKAKTEAFGHIILLNDWKTFFQNHSDEFQH